MNHENGLREGVADAHVLVGRASALRRRGGSKRLVPAAVIESAAARLFDRFVGEHLGVVVPYGPQRATRDLAPFRSV